MMSKPIRKLRYLSAILPLVLIGHSQVNAMAANCAPVEVRWGSADECKVLSTEVKDGESKVLISPPRREANKFVGVGSATFKCEVGTLTYVSGSCGNMVDSYSSQRVSTLPTAQTAPTVASSTELSPVRSQNTLKSASVTQLTNEVGSWESQMSKDMRAQEARMTAYTDTKSSETLASANSYANSRAVEEGDRAQNNSYNYANTRAIQEGDRAQNNATTYTNTKSSETLASANTYTDSKANATLNSANSYTNSSSTNTLASANSYSDSKSVGTLQQSKDYTDQKVSTTSQQSTSQASAAWWTPYVGQTYSFAYYITGARSPSYYSVKIVDSSGNVTLNGAARKLTVGGDLFAGSYSYDNGCQSTGNSYDVYFVNTASGPGFVRYTTNSYNTGACSG
jgi:hypothetical protein